MIRKGKCLYNILKFYLWNSLPKTNIADFCANMENELTRLKASLLFPQDTEDAGKVTSEPRLCPYHREEESGSSRNNKSLFQN